MFLDCKYTDWYFAIVEKAKRRGNVVGEKHHVVPRSFGGSNDTDNVVCLTYREHFICHLLLTKMTGGVFKRKMAAAFWRMCNGHQKANSHFYSYGKKVFVETHTGVPKSESHKSKLRGQRPHVNQKGENNNAFVGYWITPWGTFADLKTAASEAPAKVNYSSLSNWCKTWNEKRWERNMTLIKKGQTPKEAGFYFVRAN